MAWSAFAAVLLCAGGARTLHADESELVVTEYAWSRGVDRASREHLKPAYTSAAPAKPLYLWIRVRGNRAALDRLVEEGALPLHHRWYRTIGSELIDEDSTFDKALGIGSSKASTLRALQREVEQTGYFNWRTWSNKASISPGWWEVRIVSDDGEMLPCRVAGTLRPCEPRIRITK